VKRSGVSLVETLVATLLGAFLVHLGLTTLLRVDQFSRTLSYRHDVVMSVRVTRRVLQGELSRAGRGEDLIVGDDSIAVRAFRGVGIVCVPIGGRVAVVAYRGSRQVDPAKDSLEVVGADGSLTVLDLVGARASGTPCPIAVGREGVQEWVTDRDLPTDAVLVRPFERGSYHLSNSAFRYRRGAGGRQPLTPDVWDDPSTKFERRGSTVRVTLAPADAPKRGWSGFLGRVPPP